MEVDPNFPEVVESQQQQNPILQQQQRQQQQNLNLNHQLQQQQQQQNQVQQQQQDQVQQQQQQPTVQAASNLPQVSSVQSSEQDPSTIDANINTNSNSSSQILINYDNIKQHYYPGLQNIKDIIKSDPNFNKLTVRKKIIKYGRAAYLEYLEQRYPRQTYSVHIRSIESSNENTFGGNVNSRRDAIQENASLDTRPIEAKLLVNDITKESYVRVSVDNYADYIKLLHGSWKESAFGGIIVKRAPLDESLLICDVPDNKTYDIYDFKNKLTIDSLFDIGLVNIERDSYERFNKDTPENKTVVYKPRLRCNALDLSYFIEAVTEGVMLDMTGKLHKVHPNYRDVKVCIKCGDFTHNTRACTAPPRCTRCTSNTHTIDSCKNVRNIKCFNCDDAHSCNSTQCTKLINELCKSSENSYIIFTCLEEIHNQTTLENGFDNVYRLLNIRYIPNMKGNFKEKENNNMDLNTLRYEMESFYEYRSADIYTSIHTMKNTLLSHEQRITKNEAEINHIVEKVDTLGAKCDGIAQSVNNNNSTTNKILELLSSMKKN